MNEAERRIEEHERMMRDLVDNDPLFSVFDFVEIQEGFGAEGRKFILVKREEGAGIQMPEPGAE